MRQVAFILVFLLGFSAAPAYPSKPASGEFELAKSFYNEKKYEEAKRKFMKLLKAYPESLEASEGQYYLGLINEEQGNLYEAFKAYQGVIDKYPFSERIREIIEREYKIGEKFMSGENRKAKGRVLPDVNLAIEIFTKVIENSAYGPLAAAAQYKLGLILKSALRYYEAEGAFNKVISNYPDSEWAEVSKFQIAACQAALSRGTGYDQGAAKEAKEIFEEFSREHPDAALAREAGENVRELIEKEAESDYNTGRFYEKQKAYKSAGIYYEDIISKTPYSLWAARAIERMQVMEKKNKK
jgi:outer membrane assembly lipoprotein YfiO